MPPFDRVGYPQSFSPPCNEVQTGHFQCCADYREPESESSSNELAGSLATQLSAVEIRAEMRCQTRMFVSKNQGGSQPVTQGM